ncbi:MAG: CvpA family protein [Candidatus Latescibacteria bacterium]|jgi:membrane protein required for colicin V production|nr:CvpA family protein [Candidatus Latescibacterota bacterium]
MVNVFDLLALIITLFLAFSGYREGFLRGVIKLVGFIAIVFLMAFFPGHITEAALTIKFLSPGISIPLAFIVILIAGTCVFHLIAFAVHKMVQMTPVGFIDSGLGCAFGIIKALLLTSLIATAISFSPDGSFFKKQYDNSISAKHLITLLSEIVPPAKKSVIPLYRRYIPAPVEPEHKQDDKTIPPSII